MSCLLQCPQPPSSAGSTFSLSQVNDSSPHWLKLSCTPVLMLQLQQSDPLG